MHVATEAIILHRSARNCSAVLHPVINLSRHKTVHRARYYVHISLAATSSTLLPSNSLTDKRSTGCAFANSSPVSMTSLLKKLGGYKQQSDKPPLRPKAVLLDVNGTLFPATAAAPAFKELGLDENLVEVR